MLTIFESLLNLLVALSSLVVLLAASACLFRPSPEGAAVYNLGGDDVDNEVMGWLIAVARHEAWRRPVRAVSRPPSAKAGQGIASASC